MLIGYPFTVRDAADVGLTGLTPSVVQFKTLKNPRSKIMAAGILSIVEFGMGQYVAFYDPALYGDALAVIDTGSTSSRRYIDMTLVA